MGKFTGQPRLSLLPWMLPWCPPLRLPWMLLWCPLLRLLWMLRSCPLLRLPWTLPWCPLLRPPWTPLSYLLPALWPSVQIQIKQKGAVVFCHNALRFYLFF